MSRFAVGFVILVSLACGGGESPSASTSVPGGEVTAAAPVAAGPGDYADLEGYWKGDWGTVSFSGPTGKYTQTADEEFGTIEVKKTGERSFEGTWGENKAHFGTLKFSLSKDGERILGSYEADPSSQEDPPNGSIDWER